ncbi:hypothetical protein AtEden1_Chr2g0267641 [Arabidopsis thaliana]
MCVDKKKHELEKGLPTESLSLAQRALSAIRSQTGNQTHTMHVASVVLLTL